MINPIYSPDSKRYDNGMKYRRCGRSGILLPEVSLGLWHNFGREYAALPCNNDIFVPFVIPLF